MRREIRGHLRHIGEAIWAVTAEYLRRLVHQRRSPAGYLKAHMIHDEGVTGDLSSWKQLRGCRILEKRYIDHWLVEGLRK